MDESKKRELEWEIRRAMKALDAPVEVEEDPNNVEITFTEEGFQRAYVHTFYTKGRLSKYTFNESEIKRAFRNMMKERGIGVTYIKKAPKGVACDEMGFRVMKKSDWMTLETLRMLIMMTISKL